MEKRDYRKQRIIEAATEVLKENSVENATVRKIAEKAGLTTGALYYHYKNKDELLYDVITRALYFSKRMVEEETLTGKNKKDIEEDVLLNVKNRLRKEEEQKLYIVLISDAIIKGGKIYEKYGNAYNESLKNVERLLEVVLGAREGVSREIVASMVVALLDGLAIQKSLGVLKNEDLIGDALLKFMVTCMPDFLNKIEGGDNS